MNNPHIIEKVKENNNKNIKNWQQKQADENNNKPTDQP
jgi:hypothetical protein